ncbi:MAG: hypothetical protein WC415_04695 [Patescibacteria group bacterium]|jgi:hypothetical protein
MKVFLVLLILAGLPMFSQAEETKFINHKGETLVFSVDMGLAEFNGPGIAEEISGLLKKNNWEKVLDTSSLDLSRYHIAISSSLTFHKIPGIPNDLVLSWNFGSVGVACDNADVPHTCSVQEGFNEIYRNICTLNLQTAQK